MSYYIEVRIRRRISTELLANEFNGLYGPFVAREDAVSHLEKRGWSRVGCGTPTPNENKWFAFVRSNKSSQRGFAHSRIIRRIRMINPDLIREKIIPRDAL
jgi:hypothetical protein